ncbi:MAG: transcriptional regulator, Crp/Fnr family [Deltaproteobacteria bacterium]|nr:transcriptional regulator, Crp/Fnr family [Deltaproteobacteria bacterium]MBP2683422.1 transcriptional regulator, Crp/Fnr family [Deltaproteobacteria bacterium]
MALSVITQSDLFEGIAQPDLERIVRLFTERKYLKGATIFGRGDSGEALYIVKEGLVKLASHSGEGTETILHLLPAGAIFGEILLSEERRAFTALAETDALVSVLPKQTLVQLLSTFPAFSMNFIRLLSRRLAKVEMEFAGFGHTWSYHRLAKVLLTLGAEHGVKTPKGILLTLRLTHEELANLIGTTRETVSTQMGRFRRMGLIRREGKSLLLNVSRLAKLTREEEPPE